MDGWVLERCFACLKCAFVCECALCVRRRGGEEGEGGRREEEGGGGKGGRTGVVFWTARSRCRPNVAMPRARMRKRQAIRERRSVYAFVLVTVYYISQSQYHNVYSISPSHVCSSCASLVLNLTVSLIFHLGLLGFFFTDRGVSGQTSFVQSTSGSCTAFAFTSRLQKIAAAVVCNNAVR